MQHPIKINIPTNRKHQPMNWNRNTGAADEKSTTTEHYSGDFEQERTKNMNPVTVKQSNTLFQP